MKLLLILLLASVFHGGCTNRANLSANKLAKSSSISFGILDAHLHTTFNGKPEEYSGIPQTREELFSQMKEAGVVGGIAHAESDGVDYWPLESEGIFHCIGVDANPNLKVVEAGLKSKKFRCIKVYLGYVPQYAYHPRYRALYKLAQKYDVAVVFHTGDTYSSTAKVKYADPLTIDEVAVDFPEVRFVLAHCGNPWIESAGEVAYKNPNVFLDGSGLLIGDLQGASVETLEMFLIKPLKWIFHYADDPRKLMYGSDWPLTRLKPYVDAFKQAIPEENWKDVFRNNAIRVFKLPLPEV